MSEIAENELEMSVDVHVTGHYEKEKILNWLNKEHTGKSFVPAKSVLSKEHEAANLALKSPRYVSLIAIFGKDGKPTFRIKEKTVLAKKKPSKSKKLLLENKSNKVKEYLK